MDSKTRILIAIPCLETIKVETVISLFSMTAVLKYDAKLNIHVSSVVHDARNKLVKDAIDTGCTHVMFVDSDIVFPEDAINKLVEDDKDIVGGLYFRKQIPHLPTIHEKDGERLLVPRTYPTTRPFEVFAIGTGFLMVKTEVFKKMPQPWFYFGTYKKHAVGEDVYFCWKAQERGYKVWCDPTFDLAHIGAYGFDKRDWEAEKDIEPKREIDVYWNKEV
jgi:GT2 family glycosyltransferase